MKTVLKTVCLLACVALLVYVMLDRISNTSPTAEAEAPAESAVPAIAVTDAPAVTPTPAPTPEPTPAAPQEYTISMVGDCTLWSNANYAQHSAGIAKTVGEDYAYPFSNTVQYFENDDCTLANLECLLSDTNMTYDYTKATFAFIAPTEFTNIMLDGGVDFVTTANNHLMDCYETGRDRTFETLEGYGLPYGGERESQLFTTESGLVLGIYTAGIDMRPDWKTDEAVAAIKSLREQGAEYVICMFHWSDELYYKPYDYQISLAHTCIDAGADLIYGSHPHCLQPIEEYGEGLICYSMGNWVFGGSTMPSDPDTAIVQVKLRRMEDGSVINDGYTVIPCCVSSKLDAARNNEQNYNDYKPTPYEEGSAEYARVQAKLDGSFEPTSQGKDYSDWWASRAPTE